MIYIPYKSPKLHLLIQKTYRNILNSVVIPENKTIYLCPKSNSCNLILSSDGENKLYQDVVSIETSISEKKKLSSNERLSFYKNYSW